MRILVAGAVLAILVGGGLDHLDVAAAQQKAAQATPSSPPAELDRLLAPIALYPDQLIAQMLLCAAAPATVTTFHAWLEANKALKGTELQDAATAEGFEPAFVALALFPQVVMSMAERLDWTARLGKAFTADRSAVFDSIQRLRTQAQKSGALKDTPQQEVETAMTPGGEQVIVIEPANPQVIYVPQYDPQVVYVEDDDDDVDAAVAGVIGFTAGIAIGAAIDNDYYYGPYGWHGGVHLYNDAWDDWADARDDARDDWIDHREDLVEERGERTRAAGEQRTERTEIRQEGRTDAQAQRIDRQQAGQADRPQSQAQRPQQAAEAQARTTGQGGSTYAARGDSGGSAQARRDRSGTSTDAFSGYSNGRSESAASARGQRSRGGGGGGGGRRR